MYRNFRTAGLAHPRTLFFPQPIYPTGWWSATMARAGNPILGFREEAARTKAFATRYYNADIHLGALAAPQFFVEASRDWI
jgi:spermidine synthase